MRFSKLYFTILFIPLSLSACPFASGTYKKKYTKKSIKLPYSKNQTRLGDEIRALYPTHFILELQNRGLNLDDCLTQLSQSNAKVANQPLYSFLRDLQEHQLGLKKLSYQKLKAKIAAINQSSISSEFQQLVNTIINLNYEIDLHKTSLGLPLFQQSYDKSFNYERFSEVPLIQFNTHFENHYGLSKAEIILQNLKRKAMFYCLGSWKSFDQSISSKIATLQFQDKKLSILRMGTPVCLENYRLFIDPLFERYISLKKQQGKKHLYFNLMNQNKSGWEKKASKVLTQFAKDNEDFFFLVSLPHDGHWYEQQNYGEENSEVFIRSLHENLISQTNGFEVPHVITSKKNFSDDLISMMNQLHETTFKSKSRMTRLERTQYIDLFYAVFATYCLEVLQVDSVNWSCRHGIDRAMGALSIFCAVSDAHRMEKNSLQKALFISHWPAFSSYYRAPIQSRSVRTLSALSCLQEQGITLSQYEAGTFEVNLSN